MILNNLFSGREIPPKFDSPFYVNSPALSEIEKQKVFDFNKNRSSEFILIEQKFTTPSPPKPAVNAPARDFQDQSALLQSQEMFMKTVIEQNRSLADTCRSLTEQLQVLSLTNKELIDQMNEIRVSFVFFN